MYTSYLASAADIAQQEKIFNDAANASQKQLYRDSTAGKKLADYEKQIIDTGTVPGTALNGSNCVRRPPTAPSAPSGRPASRSTRPPASSTR